MHSSGPPPDEPFTPFREDHFAEKTSLEGPQIRDYTDSWNQNPKFFTWTATTGEILARVRLVATNVRKLVNNNLN